jgi:hypothetical protein
MFLKDIEMLGQFHDQKYLDTVVKWQPDAVGT